MSVGEGCEQQQYMELRNFLNMEKYGFCMAACIIPSREAPNVLIFESVINSYLMRHLQESRKGHIKENIVKDIFVKPPEGLISEAFNEAFASKVVEKMIADIVGNGYSTFCSIAYMNGMRAIQKDIVNGTKNFEGLVYTIVQNPQTEKMKSLVALKVTIKDIFGENYHEVPNKKLSEINVMNAAILVDNYGYFYDTDRDYKMILGPYDIFNSERLLDDTVLICAISKHGKQTPVVEKVDEKPLERVDEKPLEKPLEKPVEKETFDDEFGDDIQDDLIAASVLAYIQSSNKSAEKRLEELKNPEVPKQQPKQQSMNYQGNRQRKPHKNIWEDFAGNRQRRPGKNPQKGNSNQKGFKKNLKEKNQKEQQERKFQETVAKNAKRTVVKQPIPVVPEKVIVNEPEQTIEEIIADELLEGLEAFHETSQETSQEDELNHLLKGILKEGREMFNEHFGDEEANVKSCIALMSYFESLDFEKLEEEVNKDNPKGLDVYDLLKQ